jgi:hypothetical protein
MKYIKLFEEKTITRTAELKKFCDDNLAYLIDNNFYFSVKVSREALIQSDSNFQSTIKYTSSKRYDTIVVEKKFPVAFDFDEFSDDLVPFILFISEKYGIRSILYLDEKHKVKWPAISTEEYNDIDDLDLSSLDNTKIKRLVITIKK